MLSARVALEEDRVKRAEDGDGAVLPAIREALDEHAPEIWRDYGDLACIVENKWIAGISGDNLMVVIPMVNLLLVLFLALAEWPLERKLSGSRPSSDEV